MKLRKLWWLLGMSVLVGLTVFILYPARRTGGGNNWVMVSAPAFTNRAGVGAKSFVGFVVSNIGPQDVTFCLQWFECGTSSNLAILQGPRLGVSVPLVHGASTNLIVEADAGGATNAEGIFCCQIDWLERESLQHRWLQQVDRPMYWLGAVLDFNWDPPWRNKRPVSGELFISNIEVGEYFRRIHGFTRQDWLEEQRLKRVKSAELLGVQAQQGPTQALFINGDGERSPAKEAFERFCRATTNAVEAAHPTPAPKGNE